MGGDGGTAIARGRSNSSTIEQCFRVSHSFNLNSSTKEKKKKKSEQLCPQDVGWLFKYVRAAWPRRQSGAGRRWLGDLAGRLQLPAGKNVGMQEYLGGSSSSPYGKGKTFFSNKSSQKIFLIVIIEQDRVITSDSRIAEIYNYCFSNVVLDLGLKISCFDSSSSDKWKPYCERNISEPKLS